MTEQERHIQTVCLLILAAFATALALFWLRAVLVPFVLSLFIYYALVPLVEVQQRYLHIPRWLAVAASLGIAVLLLIAMARIVSVSVSQLVANADVYEQRLEALADTAGRWLPNLGLLPKETVEAWTRAVPADSLTDPATGASRGADIISGGDALRMLGDRISSLLVRVAGAMVGLLSQGILILIFIGFMFLGGSSGRGGRGGFLGEVENQIRRYILVKVGVSALTGLLTGLFLWILGVDLAMVFGLFAFLLNFIPSIGSIIAMVLPLPVILIDPDLTPPLVALALILPGVAQFLLGNVIEPRFMGRSLDLHPVAVMLTLIFWGTIWGVVGMFLATPMTAVVKILLERSEPTRPVAMLLAGRLDFLRGWQNQSVLG